MSGVRKDGLATRPAFDGTKRGGPRKGAGRPKGAKTENKSKLETLMGKLLDEALARGEKVTSLQLLQEIYRSKKVPVVIRQAAMRAALPYENPKYQPLPPPPNGNDDEGSGGVPSTQRMSHARDTLRRKLIKTVQPGTGGQVAVNSQ